MGLNVKAAVLRKINNPLDIVNFIMPDLKKGEVLVKIFYSGICRSQLMEIDGLRGVDKYLPHMLGHEGSGEVLKTSEGVTKFKIGDEVVLSWIKSEGLDSKGGAIKIDSDIINYGPISTFSNYSIISENRLIKKPRGYSFKLATLFGCALPTGSGIIKNEINIKNNSSIVIIGLGGIGMSAVLMSIALGNENIIAIDTSNERLEKVKEYGVKYIINGNDNDIKGKVKKIFSDGVDFCVEAAGYVSSIELGFSLLNINHGSLVFASHPQNGDYIKLLPHELISGKKIKGSWGGGVRPDIDIPMFGKILFPIKEKLNDMVSKTYQLDNINDALDDMRNQKVIRPIIKMEH